MVTTYNQSTSTCYTILRYWFFLIQVPQSLLVIIRKSSKYKTWEKIHQILKRDNHLHLPKAASIQTYHSIQHPHIVCQLVIIFPNFFVQNSNVITVERFTWTKHVGWFQNEIMIVKIKQTAFSQEKCFHQHSNNTTQSPYKIFNSGRKCTYRIGPEYRAHPDFWKSTFRLILI